jgi:spore maturation protein CgeB
MRALSRMGYQIVEFDIQPHLLGGSRIEQSLLHRFRIGRGVGVLNREILRMAKEQSYDAVWVDKGVFIRAETVQAVRAASARQIAIHYTPDPQFFYNRSHLFRSSIPHYDLLVTTKHYEVDAYRYNGARKVLTVLQGYGHHFLSPIVTREDREMFSAEIGFIGHYEPHYARRILAASRASRDVAVWGHGWQKFAASNTWATRLVRGEGVWGAPYPRALACSKIVLGLVSRLCPDQSTTRSFEIPAVGTFMLAERTPEHQELFEEGVEAEFFDSDAEMQDKIRFYLQRTEARMRIAAAGRERCIKSGYSDEHQLRRVLAALDRLAIQPNPE